MGGWGGRGISSITYIKTGLNAMFHSIKDFPLQDHKFKPLGALFGAVLIEIPY